MQRRPYRTFAIRAGSLVLAAVLSSSVLAAELGDVAVRSHIGQQLSADIELVMLAPEDMAGVQVKLAGPNVYQGANVRMHPALSSLRMSVVKRDNRQFLHLTTFQPVDAELIHLFLELGTGSRASVRSATLWLTPEPAQAAAPANPAAALPAQGAARPQAQLAASPAADAGPAPLSGTVPSAADRAAQEAQAAANRAAAMRAARMRAAANAARDEMEAKLSVSGAARAASGGTGAAAPAPAHAAGAPAHAAGAPAAAAAAPAAAVAAPAGAAPATASAAAAVKPGPAPVPIKLGPEPRVAKSNAGTGRPAACTPGHADGEALQCQALDQTNAELKTKLVDLEGKVRQLQAALGQGAAAAVPVAAAASPASAPAAAPAALAASTPQSAAQVAASAAPAASAPEAANKAGTVIPPSAPPKANGKKKREPGGINSTTLIVGGVLLLALLGGVAAYLIRRKKIKLSSAPLKVWQGWRKNKKEAAPDVPAEPAAGAAAPDKE